jgi:predicted dehydrogenase
LCRDDYTRWCKIVGAKGTIFFDFKEKLVLFNGEEFRYQDYDYNETYVSEIKDFLDKRKGNLCEFKEAWYLQRLIDACTRSDGDKVMIK